MKKNENQTEVAGLWLLRLVNVLGVIAGLVLLVVDSPVCPPGSLNHAMFEAVPLLLVGFAFLAWLAIDRPAVSDLIKQGFIALAFILWGVDLLMPQGPGSRFLGSVVIAIYVFDLAWLIEGNIKKKFNAGILEKRPCISPECRAGGICGCLDDSRVSQPVSPDHQSTFDTGHV